MWTLASARSARTLGLAVLVGLGASPGALGAADDPVRPAAWKATDCATFDLTEVPPSVDCGYVAVPLRHAEPGGPTIELATVIVRAPAESRAPDPVFVAQGGPGGSSISAFAQALIDDPGLRLSANRDHVVWDQRGTLYSKPALLCPEATQASLEAALETAPVDPDPDPETLAYRACGERLSREAGELSAFNTVENADDAEFLRVALGYDRINYYGVSYGTLLGQYLMRQHPGSVRAVILDAVVPTTFSLITDTPFVTQRIGEKYFEGCAEEPACAAAFPGLGPRFVELLDRLDRDPVVVTTYDPEDEDGETYRVKLTGELLGGLIYGALYDPSAQPAVPLVVDRATKGDFALVESLLMPGAFFDHETAEGMYTAVVCADHGDADPDAVDYAGLAPRIAEGGRAGARGMLETCREWKIELLPREVLEPVKSEIPTLLLSGNYDPITPPSFAVRVAETLGSAHLVSFPGGSHGQAFGEECATGIIRRFLDRPEEAPDAACAREPVSAYLVPTDLFVLPAVRGFVAGTDEVRVSRRFHLLLGAIVTLATALVVYPVGWLVRRARGESHTPGGGSAAISRWAPWLATVTLVVLVAFVWSLVQALFRAQETTPALLYLGAILAEDRWVFALSGIAAVLAIVVALAALALWLGGRRSLPGRLYYTVLALAAIVAVSSLWHLGLLWPTGLS